MSHRCTYVSSLSNFVRVQHVATQTVWILQEHRCFFAHPLSQHLTHLVCDTGAGSPAESLPVTVIGLPYWSSLTLRAGNAGCGKPRKDA